MSDKSNPYAFNINKEYEEYIEICKKTEENMPYTQWENHILMYFESIDNNTYLKNFKHYLINEKRNEENELDSIGSITIPVGVLFSTIFLTYMFALINLGTLIGKKTDEFSTTFLTYLFAPINLVTPFIKKIEDAKYNQHIENLGLLIMLVTIGVVIVAGIYLWIYLSNKRKNLFTRIKFFDDIISILEDAEKKKRQAIT